MIVVVLHVSLKITRLFNFGGNTEGKGTARRRRGRYKRKSSPAEACATGCQYTGTAS